MHRPSWGPVRQIDNQNLIIAAQRWETHAQTNLYRFYYAALDTHCKHFFPHQHDREDALQEIWVKIFSKIDQFTPSNQFISRIKTVATNHCIDMLRKQKRPVWVDLEYVERVPDDCLDPDDQLLFSEWHAYITRWLETIYTNEFYGEAMRLRYEEELLIHEIAEILWQKENTIKAQLRRWRQQLIENLSASYDNTIALNIMERYFFSKKTEKASPQ